MYKGKIIVCITNRRLVCGDFFAQIERIAASSLVDWLIVREKDLSAKEYLPLFQEVCRIAHKNGKKCLAHGKAALAEPATSKDIIAADGADGIHLPLADLLAANLNLSTKLRGKAKIIGASAHTDKDLAAAFSLGADYATLSPIFSTTCKPAVSALGSTFLEKACKKSPLPVFALGGISMKTLDVCIRSGAAGCCMMSALMRG